ncbi:MAG TPA: PAS domain-containing protein, partial [Burkholderiaceae bacterium]|nr:PAS domain-containing protein [Burkholderiaceae bacterium]
MSKRFDGTVLAENPDAIVVLDPGGMVLHWNAAAEAIFGYVCSEAVGHPITELIIGPDQRDEFDRVLRDAEANGLCIDESVRRRKDGARL